MRATKSCAAILVAACAVVVLSTTGASAGQFSLVDANSVLNIDTNSPGGAEDWIVDGTDQLFEQWFYFRVGQTAEQSLAALPIGTEGAVDTDFDNDIDTLFVRYENAGLFDAEVRISLAGGAVGSSTSVISEQITITNTGSTPLPISFFQYNDFDLNFTASSEFAEFVNANSVQQFEAGTVLSETVVSPAATRREIARFPSIRNRLQDASPTDLVDTPIGTLVGPTDITWAFQWDAVVPVGGSFQISKDKRLERLVPEPSCVAMLVLGLPLATRGRRRLP